MREESVVDRLQRLCEVVGGKAKITFGDSPLSCHGPWLVVVRGDEHPDVDILGGGETAEEAMEDAEKQANWYGQRLLGEAEEKAAIGRRLLEFGGEA